MISAFDLTDEQEQAITATLKSKLGRDVTITTRTDESLIGGVIIKAEDTVIDDSVRGRLTKLSHALS